jgi:hypothetical protein
MIKYFCDVTGEEMEPNDLTKARQDFVVRMGNSEVHVRAYFCIDNEGSGELSEAGMMLALDKIAREYFNEHYLDDLNDENEDYMNELVDENETAK